MRKNETKWRESWGRTIIAQKTVHHFKLYHIKSQNKNYCYCWLAKLCSPKNFKKKKKKKLKRGAAAADFGTLRLNAYFTIITKTLATTTSQNNTLIYWHLCSNNNNNQLELTQPLIITIDFHCWFKSVAILNALSSINLLQFIYSIHQK